MSVLHTADRRFTDVPRERALARVGPFAGREKTRLLLARQADVSTSDLFVSQFEEGTIALTSLQPEHVDHWSDTIRWGLPKHPERISTETVEKPVHNLHVTAPSRGFCRDF